jgi:hypothetical protein
MHLLTASGCLSFFFQEKKETKKYKHGIIAPRIRAGHRLHTAQGAAL